MNHQHPVSQATLDACASEPIRIPGGIQPHGALLVVGIATFTILQASANAAAFLGIPMRAGLNFGEGATAALAVDVKRWAESQEGLFLRTVSLGNRVFQVSAHCGAQGVIVEFESPPISQDQTLEGVYPRLRRFVETLTTEQTVIGIAQAAVREFRALTGFNRIMLYSFDKDGVGTVLAEDSDGVLPSYQGLRFPASDVPAQARELYRLNRIRLIPTATYTPVPLEPVQSPVDGKPLDLSFAALRTVSPVHLEYMRNMDTAAAMSVSILVDGALWGLISCHNQAPREINPQIRTACDFLGQIVSLQIGARERAEAAGYRIKLKQIEADLLTALAGSSTLHKELQDNGHAWLAMVAATGAALVTNEAFITYGQTPSQPEIAALAKWLHQRGIADVFATDNLASLWAPAADFAQIASGVVAIAISQIHPSYILWFRQEVVRSVNWAGDPRKPTEGPDRLNPRKSFQIWKEQVREKSLPWNDVELDSARDFRHAVINFVLRRAEERAELSSQLQRSNAELESFSYSVSHDLRAPFRHIAGFSALLAERATGLDDKSKHYLQQILDTTVSAGLLVDSLLNFSHLGRVQVDRMHVDMRKLFNEAKHFCEQENTRAVNWQIEGMPLAWGDPSLLRQVWINLISNALKYSSPREDASITVSGEDLGRETRYSITDNGVGFDMAYVGKLFGVFQRLHRSEEFPGTGIGLALVKRIIDRHGGTVTAHGELNKGATFTFTLPKVAKDKE